MKYFIVKVHNGIIFFAFFFNIKHQVLNAVQRNLISNKDFLITASLLIKNSRPNWEVKNIIPL